VTLALVNDKILDVPKMWKNETLQLKITTSSAECLQTHWIHSENYKINLAISFLD
jgi:hypothetical protein